MKKISVPLIIVALAIASLSCRFATSMFTQETQEPTPDYHFEPVTDELIFSPDTLPEGMQGEEYQAVITLTGQRTPAFEIGAPENSLPMGLEGTFDQDNQTYTIEGVPLEAGTFDLAVSAVCYGTQVSGQMGEKDYQLVIK
jgi:hypothetical protein